jgi:hypothetical protein
METHSDSALGAELERELRLALPFLEFPKWGYFWPFTMALWRFLRKQRPTYFDDLDTSFDEEPTFSGRPANWFCEHLLNDEEILNDIDTFMRRIADSLSLEAKHRGYLTDEGLPEIDPPLCGRVALRALALTDQAVRQGDLKP